MHKGPGINMQTQTLTAKLPVFFGHVELSENPIDGRSRRTQVTRGLLWL